MSTEKIITALLDPTANPQLQPQPRPTFAHQPGSGSPRRAHIGRARYPRLPVDKSCTDEASAKAYPAHHSSRRIHHQCDADFLLRTAFQFVPPAWAPGRAHRQEPHRENAALPPLFSRVTLSFGC